jgi:hypothetical protein
MDHAEVVRLNAAEKYSLGELPQDLVEQFEEHYFDCPECANDVKTLATFVTAGRMVFEEEGDARAASPRKGTARSRWFSWLRPAAAVPVFAALAAVILFQNAVTIPSLKERLADHASAQLYEASYRLQGTTRGETTSKVSIRAGESFGLVFDFTPTERFAAYQGSLVDSSGKTVLTFGVKGEEANKELHLAIAGDKVRPGTYDLVFVGDRGKNQGAATGAVQRLTFVVENRL